MIQRLLIVAAATLFIAACGDDGDQTSTATDDLTPGAQQTSSSNSSDDGDDGADDGDLAQYEEELRETVPAAFTAMFAGGGVEAYFFASDDFKEKCSLEEFIGVTAFIKIFLGDLEEEDIAVEVTDIRYEEGRAYVTAEGTIMGEPVEPEDDDSLSQFWVREDGEWKWGTDDAEPCKTDGVFESSDDSTPATGPGSSRAEPAPIGEPVEIDDLRITVLDANLNAGLRLAALTEYETELKPGRVVVLVQLKVEHAGEDSDETISVFDNSFKITGSNNLLYDSFDEGTSCGVLRDGLDGEMFPGGSLEGLVCFQVPDTETNLILVADPAFEDDRRYFALQ